MWPVAGKKNWRRGRDATPAEQTTTKGGYRGDNINDVGADYREQGRACQVDVCLFYFVVVIDCFCIVFL